MKIIPEFLGNTLKHQPEAPVLNPDADHRKYVEDLRAKASQEIPTIPPIPIEELTIARDKLNEIRGRYEIVAVEQSIRALKAVTTLQQIDKELKKLAFRELNRFKVIRQILDGDSQSTLS